MKVKEIMTTNAVACTPTNNLAEAASLMWDNDCGILPVVSRGGKVIGLITDRDICMAAATKGRNPSNIAVEEVISGRVFSCTPEMDVREALRTMQERRVRRLAVVATDGTLEGILSMNDVVLNAKDFADKRAAGLLYDDVINTYKAICTHPLPLKQQAQSLAAGV